jgi:hypothetical protein
MFNLLRPTYLTTSVLALAAFTLGNGYSTSDTDLLIRGSSQLAGVAMTSRMLSIGSGKPQCLRAVGPFSLFTYKPQSPDSERVQSKLSKGVEFKFPLGVSMLDSDWSVCFGDDSEPAEPLKVRVLGPTGDIQEVAIGIGDGSVFISEISSSS